MPVSNTSEGTILGHPRGLFILFFAEMWERFSFYGMKALLPLYMLNYLFWSQSEQSHVLALYTGGVYATPIIGGLIADKLLGARWSVVIGGILIAIGHFLLAFEPLPFFYSGMIFVCIGTGFLKPNVSTQVGALYRSKDERRDSAFTIFYMGINTGAFLGPIICGYLRLNFGWHYGFAAAGVGMVLGLIVYLLGMGTVVRRERLIRAEEQGAHEESPQADASAEVAAAGGHAEGGPSLTRIYFDRSVALVLICLFAVLFWVGFEQAANVMNVWADKHTNLFVFRSASPVAETYGQTGSAPASASAADSGWLSSIQITAEQTQSINPLFVILLAGVFAWMWNALERRGRQPSTPMKMALGVFFLSCAYGMMMLAAQAENKARTAPLSAIPSGLQVDEQGRVYGMEEQNGTGKRMDLGETRLRWKDSKLMMSGVLTDLDWMRALGETCPAEFAAVISDLKSKATDRAEEVRQAKKAGEMDRDATWEVSVRVPGEVGELWFIAGLPDHVTWDPESRTLTAKGELSSLDMARLRAGGADPAFRDALTTIYVESSKKKVSLLWLIAFYLILTIGELCLSPVGLSLVTKAAPPKYVGMFMGFWFLTTGAVANFLAHSAGGYWGTMEPGTYFMIFGAIGLGATVLMLIMLRFLRPMLHGIH